jgi:hypothetical protein
MTLQFLLTALVPQDILNPLQIYCTVGDLNDAGSTVFLFLLSGSNLLEEIDMEARM